MKNSLMNRKESSDLMKKQIISAMMAAALLLSVTACGKTESEAASLSTLAGQTFTGTVSAVSAKELSLDTEASGTVTIPLSEDTVFERAQPEMGGQAPGGGAADGETPPEKPEGESSDGETPPAEPDGGAVDGETPPEKPDGEAADGETPPEMPDGETPPDAPDGATPENGQPESLTYEDVTVGDAVTVEVGEDGVAATVTLPDGGQGGGMGGPSSAPDSYDAANTYTEDTQVSGSELTSTGKDENAVLVATEGITASLDDVTITRQSEDSTGGDSSSFYGVGAAALVTDGTLKIADSTITTDAAGGAGVFAYGDGTAYVSDTTITTAQDTSGGIHVAGGGTLYAWDLNVETNGESAAAIRSDRGSGTMVVDGGSYTSNGVGSPAVYSTADITVHNADLAATGSEAICIEGLNTIRLFDCNLSGNMSDLDQNDCTWNVILYQSMSGDSEEGNSTFEMVGGTLTAQNGGMFYTTNTESTFILSGVDITGAADSEFLLKCTGNANGRGWGTSGANGADCHFTGIGQTLEGDVIWDSISCLDFYLTQGSTLTGAVVQDESCAGEGGDGYASLYLDTDSRWVVTGDSTLTNLQCAGTIVDEAGNTVSIVGTDGTVYVSGNSSYTITVSSYTAEADVSGASAVDSWSSYEVAQS